MTVQFFRSIGPVYPATALDVGHWDASMCGLRLGDRISLENTMYGLLLPSGNEAAEVIAEYISGDVDSFVQLMNERAMELGMQSTNFGNPHGLPCDGHLTSAYDISLLMKELLTWDKFFDIAEHGKFLVACMDAGDKGKVLEMKNSNQYLAGKKTIPDGIEILGGKTGYTDLAGRCLVIYVKTDSGRKYIAELFGAQNITVLYDTMNLLLEVAKEYEKNNIVLE